MSKKVIASISPQDTYLQAVRTLANYLLDKLPAGEYILTLYTYPNGRWGGRVEIEAYNLKVGDILIARLDNQPHIVGRDDDGEWVTRRYSGAVELKGRESIIRFLECGKYHPTECNVFDLVEEWAEEVDNEERA